MIPFSQEWFDMLNKEVEAGNVRVAKSSGKPLKIYNYTHQAQFLEHWNEVTRKTRGLILNDRNPVVIPPEKFFNLGEEFAAPVNLLNARITEKLDGIMIIIKVDSDWGLIIASRGSFDNKYTEAAKKFLTDDVVSKLIPDYTYFCELCQNFPGDEALILTKHPIPKLVCWAIRDENFNEVMLNKEYPFPIVRELSLAEVKQYLQQEVEGVVAQDRKTGERIKLKTKWYLENHRLISHCTKKRMWDMLVWKYRDGIPYDLAQLDIPDEYMFQMRAWEKEFLDELTFQLNYYKNLGKNMTDQEISQSDLSKHDKFIILAIRHNKKGFKSAEFNIINSLKPKDDIME